MNKRVFAVIFIVAIAIGAYFTYKWVNKPVVDMSMAECKIRFSAVELFDVYSSRESYADSCFSGQIIEVFGKVRSLSINGPNKSLVLETNDMIFGIDCGIDSTHHQKLNQIKEGNDISIRGECAGLNGDVVMVRCIIL
ncbi:MAG: OB-fold protein [Bacteroidota bacterium]